MLQESWQEPPVFVLPVDSCQRESGSQRKQREREGAFIEAPTKMDAAPLWWRLKGGRGTQVNPCRQQAGGRLLRLKQRPKFHLLVREF